MGRKSGHECECQVCQDGENQQVIQEHRQFNRLLDRLNEQQRRWVAAREALKLGHGGFAAMALITGIHPETIRRGRDELQSDLADQPTDRIRKPGGGRPLTEKKTPH